MESRQAWRQAARRVRRTGDGVEVDDLGRLSLDPATWRRRTEPRDARFGTVLDPLRDGVASAGALVYFYRPSLAEEGAPAEDAQAGRDPIASEAAGSRRTAVRIGGT